MPYDESPFPPDGMPGEVSQVVVVPHNREAEEAAIGAVLINPEVYYDLAQFLHAEDFYIHKFRWVWEAFQRLIEAKLPIDFLTTCDELQKYNQLEEVGGPAYLTGLVNATPTSLHAEAYGHMIESQAVRRRLVGAANGIATVAMDQQKGLDEVIGESEKSLFGVLDRRQSGDVQPLKVVVSDFYDELDRRSKLGADGMMGVPTGFIDLDRMTAGMQRDDLLVVAGRPGSGKSSFLSSVFLNTALIHKKKPVIFSLEMSKSQIVQRLMAMQTGINSMLLRTGKLEDEQWPLVVHSTEVMGDLTAFIDDTPSLTPSQLSHKARRLVLEFDIDLIMVDYMQLMASGFRNENRVQEVSYVARALKTIARELHVPVLAAAQLSRAVEQRSDKRPVLSDLRESGEIEQAADVVMFIYRPDQYEKDSVQQNVAEIILAKHRNGPTGSVELVFLSQVTKFVDAATRSSDGESYRRHEEG